MPSLPSASSIIDAPISSTRKFPLVSMTQQSVPLLYRSFLKTARKFPVVRMRNKLEYNAREVFRYDAYHRETVRSDWKAARIAEGHEHLRMFQVKYDLFCVCMISFIFLCQGFSNASESTLDLLFGDKTFGARKGDNANGQTVTKGETNEDLASIPGQ